MERVFQRSFRLSHYYTTGHARDTFREENTINAAEVFLEAGGCDEIRLEMLKVLNRGVLWLTGVCQVAWYSGRASKDWQIGIIIPTHRKGDWS